MANGTKLLTVFTKGSILDVWLGSYLFGQRTFFSIIKLIFWEKREFYLFYYNAFFKDRVLIK